MFDRLIPEVVHITACATDTMLVDGDRAAGLNRLTGRLHATGASSPAGWRTSCGFATARSANTAR